MSQAGPIDIVGSNPDIPVLFITNDGEAVPIANILELLGEVVPAGVNPFRSVGSGNTVTYQVQYSQDSPTSNPLLAGISSFNSDQFTVDENGFVSLNGGGQAIDSFTTDVSGPVGPDGNGNIAFTGSTNIFTDGSVANTMRLNLQGINHALFVGRGANIASASLTTGSSGQLLQSGGASIDPAWTTSTYPTTNAQGDLIFGSAANVYSNLAKDTNATRYLSNTGVANSPAWDLVDLSNGVTGIVPLSNGGTNASLTASNGGIFYSSATAGGILAGTATARQMLQSGASTTPSWSTSTWPATTTVNRLLYSSSANTVADLPTANGGVLTTSATGVPSIDVTNFRVLTTGVQMKGNNTNTAPPAGFIGEQIKATRVNGSSLNLTSGVAANLTSISLTAGIWDTSCVGTFICGATTLNTNYAVGISTTSATFGPTPSDDSIYFNTAGGVGYTSYGTSFTVPSYRLTLASTTTVYLVVQANFSVSTCVGYGTIKATRVG